MIKVNTCNNCFDEKKLKKISYFVQYPDGSKSKFSSFFCNNENYCFSEFKERMEDTGPISIHRVVNTPGFHLENGNDICFDPGNE